MDDDAAVLPPHPLRQGRIAVYGGSIDQGACASRPGMAYTNILSRWMNTEFVNWGFSGSGKAEAEVAKALSEIDDVRLFGRRQERRGRRGRGPALLCRAQRA